MSMTIVVERQFDKCGDEYPNEERVEVTVYNVGNKVFFETGDSLYVFPRDFLQFISRLEIT